MGWFEEQLQFRRQKDDESFADAINGIAGAIMGRRLSDAMSQRDMARSAVEQILKYYHCKSKSAEEPADIAKLSTEEYLDYRLRPFGMMRRTVILEGDWYNYAVGALLGTLKENGTAVALLPGRISGYFYVELQTGKEVRITRKNRDIFDEEALCFYQSLPLRSIGIKDLLIFMAEQLSLSDALFYVIGTGVAAVLGLITPWFTKWLFGNVLESGSARVLVGLAGFMVCYSICNLFFSAFRSLMNSRIGIKQNIAVEAAVMSRILSLPPGFFRKYSSGELTHRAQSVQSLCSIMVNTIGITCLTSLFSLIYIGQVFTFAPALVVPSVLITLLTVALSITTTFLQMRVRKEALETSAKTGGLTYSIITGIQKIKLAGAEKRMFARWGRSYAKMAALEYNPPAFLKLNGTINLAVSLAGSLIMYALAIKNRVGVADYYAFNSAYGMISSAFMSLTGIATAIGSIRPSLNMAKPILEAQPEISEGKTSVTDLSGSIELDHVSFTYDEQMSNVIDNLNLKIKKGEYLAIVGSTGCGKSTLLRLLMGFETPQKGAIYYDRKDIKTLDLQSLHRKIGVVMQDGRLFQGDIYSNIVISAPHLTLDQAWEAAEVASLADDIRAMPMGMNTMICEGSGGISGGQRQRLMIARAVASKPKILMFDEATSALDNITQKKVTEAIDKLKCTRIVIAHRLSTIRHADRIIVLDRGKIVEDGAYEELISLNGFFAELVARQRLDLEEKEMNAR